MYTVCHFSVERVFLSGGRDHPGEWESVLRYRRPQGGPLNRSFPGTPGNWIHIHKEVSRLQVWTPKMGRCPFQEFLRTHLYNLSFCLHTTGEGKKQLLIFFPCVWVIKKPGLPWSPFNRLPNTVSESHKILQSACLKVSSGFKHCRAFQVCAVTPFSTHESNSERPKSQGILSSLLYSVCLFILLQHKQ